MRYVFCLQTLGTRIYFAEKVLHKSAKEALPLLEAAIADPSTLTATVLSRLQALQQLVESNKAINISQRKLFVILDVVYCSLYTVAEIAGIPLIIILRRSESGAEAQSHQRLSKCF